MDEKQLTDVEKFQDELFKTFNTGKHRPDWVEPEPEEVPVVRDQITILLGIKPSLVFGTYEI